MGVRGLTDADCGRRRRSQGSGRRWMARLEQKKENAGPSLVSEKWQEMLLSLQRDSVLGGFQFSRVSSFLPMTSFSPQHIRPFVVRYLFPYLPISGWSSPIDCTAPGGQECVCFVLCSISST